MSVRRISRPGYPTYLIDDGPAIHVKVLYRGGAQISGSGIGGIFVVGRSTAQKHAEEVAAQLFVERRRAAREVTCGMTLPILGTPCARAPGHQDACRSEHALEAKRCRKAAAS